MFEEFYQLSVNSRREEGEKSNWPFFLSPRTKTIARNGRILNGVQLGMFSSHVVVGKLELILRSSGASKLDRCHLTGNRFHVRSMRRLFRELGSL